MARAKSGTKSKPFYSVHPGVAMVRKWVKEKTGRSLDEWIALIQESGPPTVAERREWLKKVHKLGTNSAWWIAERASAEGNAPSADDDPGEYLKAATHWVEDMYAGAKAALRPLHDRLIKLTRALGPDVRICPCETMVPLYRQHVFAEIKPATRTRIDFGLALKGAKGRLPRRLIDTGGLAKKDRIIHRFALTAPAEVDDEVQRRLKVAYDLDA